MLIFLGNFYFSSGASTSLARRYFTKALSQSALSNWNYFVSRSFYGLALAAQKDGNKGELTWTVNVLRAFVEESESVYFSYLVNEYFKHESLSIDTHIEFDCENKRIMLRNRWINFHDKPLLYKFLEILHKESSFVSKKLLASSLWPEDPYKPRVHDPRIFDIAKRARQMIEAYENQPVVLLSGRLGYKLAVC